MISVHRSTLHALASRASHRVQPDHTGHINYRYLTLPEKIERLHYLKQQNRAAQCKIKKLQAKLANVTDRQGISLNADITSDLHQIMAEEKHVMHTFLMAHCSKYSGSNRWRQHEDLVRKKSMHWHPLMIKWCLYLCHQSSKYYETLRLWMHPLTITVHLT